MARNRARRRGVAWCAGLAATLVVSLSGVALADGAEDAGSVEIVDADGSPLRNGGSSTPFRVQLPPAASCPGDSMHDEWRVQSFIVPTDADVTTLNYSVIGPDGPSQYALFDLGTRPYTNQLTMANGGDGVQGLISGVPMMSYGVLSPGMLPAGRYRIGISCTLFGETGRYWDTEIVLENAPDDTPAQFVWRLPDAPTYEPSDSDGGGMGRWIGLGLLLIGVGLIGGVFVARARSHRDLSKEST